jgi:hypothetical protein
VLLVRLVLLATAGNQRFVFASNRLREAVGASELVRASTTDWVVDAVAGVRAAGGWAEPVQMSSGSTLVVADDDEGGVRVARQLIGEVTSRALRAAPGLDVFGASVPIGQRWPSAADVTAVFGEAARVRSARAGGVVRFQRLPAVAGCASTGGPAALWSSDAPATDTGEARDGEPVEPRSAEVAAKRRSRRAADRRMRALVRPPVRLLDIDDFFDGVEVVGVVHIDGNGLGGLFQQAGAVVAQARDAGALSEAALGAPVGERAVPGDESPPVAYWLGELSRRVQRVTEEALAAAAVRVAPAAGRLALVPLVVGGDDTTVLLDGAAALDFVEAFLEGFGAASQHDALIGLVARGVTGQPGLTAAAGVALVKPHFPFSAAYGLAEDLCRSAKTATRHLPAVHAVDVHVLLDSVMTSLDAIRARYRARGAAGDTWLHERPFVLPATAAGLPPEIAHSDLRVVRGRVAAVAALGRGRAEGRLVTSAQLHALREELHVDPELAERRFGYLWSRSAAVDRDLLTLLAGAVVGDGAPGPGLLRPTAAGRSTCLVDTLELAGLVAQGDGA